MKKKFNVAFVMHGMHVAGAEVLVCEIIKKSEGVFNPFVVCIDSVGELGQQLIAKGIPVHCLHRKPGRDWKLGLKLANLLSSLKIDVVHAHQYTPFFYSAIARVISRFRFKLILTEHGRHVPDIVSSKRLFLNRLVFDRLASAINACAQFSARALSLKDGFRGNRIQVILNGIHTDRYIVVDSKSVAKARLGLNPTKKQIAIVARFHPVKNHRVLIQAFSTIARKIDHVELLLIGDGPLRAEIEQQIIDLQLQDRVHLLGVRHDVADLLSAVDLFTLTSRSEAASITVLEAMASRLPIVVTNVGGNPEMIRNQQEGLLVDDNNAEQLSDALLFLLNSPDIAKQLGLNARKRVEECYSIENTTSQYIDLYKRLAHQ